MEAPFDPKQRGGHMNRSDLFVFLAFAVGWILIGAWVYRIGTKVSRLSARMDEEGSAD